MLALDGMYRTIRELHDKTVNAGKAGVSQVSAIEPAPETGLQCLHISNHPSLCALLAAPLLLHYTDA